MAAQSYEFTGKTVDEAMADGLKTLKLRTDQVDVEVLSKGSRGIFGIGSEPAHIRLMIRPTVATPEIAPATPAAPPSAATEQAEPARPVDAPTIDPARKNNEPISQPVAPSLEAALPAPAAAASATQGESTQAATPSIETAQPEEATDEVLVQFSVELLTKMIQLLGFKAQIVPTWKEADDKTGEYDERFLLLDIHGADLGVLIGRRGETLDNIQYLLRLMVNQRLRQWKNIVVDVEQYKARRVTQLTQLAMRMAEQVTTSGRAISLEPMPANERRVVHLALRDHPTVYTESTGDGERRKVNIVAKR